jgi:hypothetical protein
MTRKLAVLAIVAVLAGCELAGKTGIIRHDTLTDAQAVIQAMQINHGELTITGAVDHADTTYEVGQPITLSVTVSKDAYVAILRTMPDGTTTMLFPNKAHPDAAVAANAAFAVPGAGGDVKIATAKPGVELFEFIASTQKGAWLFTRAPAEGSDFPELGVTTRAIAKDIVSALNIGKGPETVATYLTIRVSK